MVYTTRELVKLAGVSSRTLRHYGQIGLLPPAGRGGAGERLYGPAELDRLQQILFLRELGVPLAGIAGQLDRPGADTAALLERHRTALMAEADRLAALIKNVERTIEHIKGGVNMTDKEKFEGFKREQLAENERKYGEEIREKYGEETIKQSNAKFMALTEQQLAAMQALNDEIIKLLDEAFAAGDPAAPMARLLVEKHREWLGYTWSEYSIEAHRGLGDMYVADRRFAEYYDRGTPGKAEFMRDCIYNY